MIVLVVVERERARGLGAEQAGILGVLRDGIGHAGAADVAIDANDAIALRHDDVEVMADEEDADATDVTDTPDEIVQLGFAGVVDTAHGLVEHEKIGFAQQRAGEHDALQFAAGKL